MNIATEKPAPTKKTASIPHMPKIVPVISGPEVDPNRNVPIAIGTKINFGKIEGEIRV